MRTQHTVQLTAVELGSVSGGRPSGEFSHGQMMRDMQAYQQRGQANHMLALELDAARCAAYRAAHPEAAGTVTIDNDGNIYPCGGSEWTMDELTAIAKMGPGTYTRGGYRIK